MSCATWSLYIHNRLSWQTNDWSKTSLFSPWHQSQLACTSAKVEEKKGEMLCKSVIDKNKTEQILTFSLIAMSEVCSIVCTFLHVQSTDYIHTYRHHFLFVLFLPFVDKPNTHRERERERDLWLSWRLWKDQGRKFQTQGRDHQQSEAYQATLTRTLSSMTSPSTTSESASPLLYRFDSPPESAFSDPYTPSLSLSLFVCVSASLCSYFCCVCVSLFTCLLTSISLAHMSYHIYTKQI